MRCALVRCTHGLETGKRRPGVGRPLNEPDTASRVGFARMVAQDTGTVVDLSSKVLSLVAVRRFVSPHIEEECERSGVKCLFERHSCEVWLLSCERLVRVFCGSSL